MDPDDTRGNAERVFDEISSMKIPELRLKGKEAGIEDKVLNKMTEKTQFLEAIISKRTGMHMDKLRTMDVFKRVEMTEKKRQENANTTIKLRTQLSELQTKWREEIGEKFESQVKSATQ